jgi:hypothetical protein
MKLKRCRLRLPMAESSSWVSPGRECFAKACTLETERTDGSRFNDAKRAENFEAGGEMGVAIRVRWSGTVGRHWRQRSRSTYSSSTHREAVERPAPPVRRSSGAMARRASRSAELYMECQTASSRATRTRCRGFGPAAGTGTKGTNGQLPDAARKDEVRGLIYKPELEFELQFNWPDVNNTPPQFSRTRRSTGISRRSARFRFGQFKAPFGRQQLTSSGRSGRPRHHGCALQRDAKPARGLGRADEQDRLARHDVGQTAAPDREREQQVPVLGRVMAALGNTRMNQCREGC